MNEIVVRKDFIKITGDFTIAIILSEMVKIAQEFRKEFIENKWSCAEYFKVNLEKISEDNMLGLSKITIRRCIKKLSNLSFILVDKTEKVHKYKVNFEEINACLFEVGGELIEKIKPNFNEFEGYTQVNKEQNLNKISFVPSEDFDIFKSVQGVIDDVIYSNNNACIKINGQNKPMQIVKSIFLKIKEEHIKDIIDKFKSISYKITNFKRYMTTLIYNYYIEYGFMTENKDKPTIVAKNKQTNNKFINFDQSNVDFKKLRELEIKKLHGEI